MSVTRSQTIIEAQSAGATVGYVTCPFNGKITFYIRPNGTVSSGVVTIEEAQDKDYTGTWSTITTVSPSTGAGNAVHIEGSFGALRARISTAIGGGGTVDVRVVGGE